MLTGSKAEFEISTSTHQLSESLTLLRCLWLKKTNYFVSYELFS